MDWYCHQARAAGQAASDKAETWSLKQGCHQWTETCQFTEATFLDGFMFDRFLCGIKIYDVIEQGVLTTLIEYSNISSSVIGKCWFQRSPLSIALMELHELWKITTLFFLCLAFLDLLVSCGLIIENSLLTWNLITFIPHANIICPWKGPLLSVAMAIYSVQYWQHFSAADLPIDNSIADIVVITQGSVINSPATHINYQQALSSLHSLVYFCARPETQ